LEADTENLPHKRESSLRFKLISTLANSNTLEQSYATGSPNQRKIIVAKDMFWVFFSDGENLVYGTSNDGNNWKSMIKTKIETGPTAEPISLWNDRNNDEIIYSRQRHEDKTLEIGKGSLGPDGTVSWQAKLEIKTKFPGQYPGTFVCGRTQGDIWAGTTTLDKQENRHTEIWRSDQGKSELMYEANFGPKTAIRPPIILATSNGIILIYGRTHHSDKLFITSTANGRDWADPWVSPYNFCLGGATVKGSKLYYCGPSEEGCRFFTFGIDTRSEEDHLVIEPQNVVQATMASDGENRLVAIYSNKGKDCAIYYRLSEDLGKTWGDRKILADRESITGFSLTATNDIVNSEIGVAWSSGSLTPFKVRFGKIVI
jgi:hypothetical protein